ncbi:hypothetical protein KI811_17700 [Geobacter hydrogenophilus]|uniref:Uncharacterized protein n=1 Tax=Geobacter hydrogenophilus TaxID=40983 RepID=A0A9W6L9V4_9BACT|nr:hypothetical protein [Geobacter hydrogenophilus]MBT0895643.1 hypothetical protein [Geobacter hydrogenophilus]GLI36808.1 hypothetical protein GHYDROH2_03090 [Geobacter hydrogenophilus]
MTDLTTSIKHFTYEGMFRVMQSGEGREGCCLDLAEGENYTPRNVPDFLQGITGCFPVQAV